VLFLLMQVLNIALNFLCIFAVLPDVMPFFSLLVLPGVDDLEHILGWVLIFTALARSLVLEVVQQGLGILTNVTEVDSLATFGEEEKTVELLKEDGAGLMDSAKDGLAGC
jgi:hypothetical protein